MGRLRLCSLGDSIIRLDFSGSSGVEEWFVKYFTDARVEEGSSAVIERLKSELDGYFAGAATTFDVPISPRGTEFQVSVWGKLRGVPYGRTVSYGRLATLAGKPGAARAVGMACHRNPVGIVIPCHRVVGSDGSLTGFGGGLEAKALLLRLEGFR